MRRRRRKMDIRHASHAERLANQLGDHHRASLAHGLRTRELAYGMAHHVGFTVKEARDISIAALLHDLGKVQVPVALLDAPRRLTESEWRTIVAHPTAGEEMARVNGFSREICRLIRGHHERKDGTGYPDGLQGADITLAQQIVIVADVWDATGSVRPYGVRPLHAERLALIRSLEFDRVYAALVNLVGETICGMVKDEDDDVVPVCQEVLQRFA